MINLYPVQKKFISHCKSVIDKSSIGIFSSPTGTGKTLSLLLSVIDYTSDTKNLSVENQHLLQLLTDISTNTKIIYTSRTHTQLNQAFNELQKLNNKIPATILASRKIYCINEKLQGIQDIETINELCKKLTTNNKCKYYTTTVTDNMDIDQLIKHGKKTTSCPYYTAYEKLKHSDIIFCSYNLLLSSKELKNIINNSIVIIDEAHNIYNTIIDMYTIELSIKDITIMIKQLYKYQSKYEDRMNNINKLKLNIIISILERINAFSINNHTTIEYNNNNTKDNTEEDIKILSVSEFLIQSDLLDYNFIEIEEYIKKSNILSKITDTNKTTKNYKSDNNSNVNKDYNDEIYNYNTNNKYSVIKFLRLLTESDKYGRILYNSKKIKFTPMDPKIYFEEILNCKSLILAGGTMEPIDSVLRLLGSKKDFNNDYQNEDNESIITSNRISIKNNESIINSNRIPIKDNESNINSNNNLLSDYSGNDNLLFNIYSSNDKKISYYSYNAICNDFLPLIIPKNTDSNSKDNINLNYKNRDKNVDDIVNILFNLSNTIKKGGAVYFFPSKSYLNGIKEKIENKFKGKIIVFEEDFYNNNKNDKKEDKDNNNKININSNNNNNKYINDININSFEEYSKAVKYNKVNIFCVMGGRLSEGINFNDELCRLLVIVGIPYPTVNKELEERINVYNKISICDNTNKNNSKN
ncbi:DNA repair helicase, partial [Spraguea lophii 42_110]